jgi:hypothetical protein
MIRRLDPHRARHRMAALALATAAAAAMLAPPAAAQGPLPEDNAGADQYIEPVPDAGGDRRPDDRDGGGRGDLPRDTRDALPPGEEGRALDRIATDPSAGAPPAAAAAGGSREGGGDGRGSKDGGEDGEGGAAAGSGGGDGSGPLSALASAVTDSDSSALPLLLIALAGLTLAGVAARRGRRS